MTRYSLAIPLSLYTHTGPPLPPSLPPSLASILRWLAQLYAYERSESTSYWAHIGGMLVGAIAGSLLLENLEVTDFERYYMLPGIKLMGVVLAIGSVYMYITVFPAVRLELRDVDKPRCCVQFLECPELDPADYARFQCVEAIHVRGGYNYRETCDDFLAYVEKEERKEAEAAEEAAMLNMMY